MVTVFAFFVIGALIMMLVVSSEKTANISSKMNRRKYIKKIEQEKEELRREAIRKAHEETYNKFLKKQALKLTPGYAVRRDGRIKKIPKKYLPALNNCRSFIGLLPGDYEMLGEFEKRYSDYKL